MSDTIIWICGATQGIGLELARLQPYPGARIINVSRRRHPDYETVIMDTSDPATWPALRSHFEKELAAFKGRRAIFFNSGYLQEAIGLIGSYDSDVYARGAISNAAAPMAMGEAFIRNVRPGYESGMVMMSSGAGVALLEGLSSYCAGRGAVEHWAQVAARERQSLGLGPWVVAVRPGGTNTAGAQHGATLDPKRYPRADAIKRNLHNRLKPDAAARHIWDQLPPPPGISLISFAPPPTDPARIFDAPSVIKNVEVEGWKLVYEPAKPA